MIDAPVHRTARPAVRFRLQESALNPHQLVLLLALALGAFVGVVAAKTHFCTMGAVSDWINIGDRGRFQSWLLAIAVAMLGVAALDLAGVRLGTDTFPPFRTANFAWLRYVLGGLMFGVGMTLASGCGNKTLLRLGAGNLKSLVVLFVTGFFAWLMLWTDFYAQGFDRWMAPFSIDLAARGFGGQGLGDLLGLAPEGSRVLGAAIGLAIVAFVFSKRDFRSNADLVAGGLLVGLAVTAGWALTAGSLGAEWREFAEMEPVPPARVGVQSLTFISPMGDGLRYLMAPSHGEYLSFGMAAMVGVVLGSLAWALVSRSFRIEWFRDLRDARNHVAGAALMGVGGILAMGCTIGQGITGLSTLALGSLLTFAAIVAGAAATMKYQYWRMMSE